MNSYLKEIADLCEINKQLTFHIARHTFATSVTLTNGVPIEIVSKMLGHKNLRATQHYAKILDRKVSDDMRDLKNKLFSQKSLPEIGKVKNNVCWVCTRFTVYNSICAFDLPLPSLLLKTIA